MSFPLIFKEGANGGGPPDLRGRRQNPRPQRARMRSRVNNSARPLSQKENPPAQAAHCPQATWNEASVKGRSGTAFALPTETRQNERAGITIAMIAGWGLKARFETGRRRDIGFQARRRIIFDISNAVEPLAEQREARVDPEAVARQRRR